jgi:uncharacterized protein (TIGR02118 family)
VAAFVALWPKADDEDGFHTHYRETHLPIVEDYPGATSVKTFRITGTPRGEEAPFDLVTVVEFDSAEDMKAGLMSDAGSRSAQDAREVAKTYGNVPVLLLAEDFTT